MINVSLQGQDHLHPPMPLLKNMKFLHYQITWLHEYLTIETDYGSHFLL